MIIPTILKRKKKGKKKWYVSIIDVPLRDVHGRAVRAVVLSNPKKHVKTFKRFSTNAVTVGSS